MVATKKAPECKNTGQQTQNIEKRMAKHQEFSAVTDKWRAGHYESMHPGTKQLPKGVLGGRSPPP